MLNRIAAFFLLLVTSYAFSQPNPTAEKYASTITAGDLKANLSIIASDAMEGRETGKRGQKMAAAFIAFTFQELGLQPPVNGMFYQPVPLYSTSSPEVILKSGTTEINREEYIYTGSGNSGGLVELSLIFAGKGTPEELEKLSIKDNAVAVMLEGNASFNNNPVVVSLRERGAKSIFVIMEKEEDFSRLASRMRNFSGARLSLSRPGSQAAAPGMFLISQSLVPKLFNSTMAEINKAIVNKKISKFKPVPISYLINQSIQEISSENVLGYLEGSDKKDEVVVVTAHYDHIGISSRAEGDKINNGADDDGSGTVAVLAMARAFAQAKKEGNGPRRSILFMTVTGEEKGLLGSSYYTDNPVYSLDKTVVNLNIDMIGRSDPQHKDSAPYVYVIGSDKLSTELHQLSENVNNTYHKLLFDYTYNDQNHPDRLYYRSDHWNFAKKNIPIIFYFDGIHEDYHKVSDEVDKIEFELLTKRTQTVFYTAWEIANRDNRLSVDKK